MCSATHSGPDSFLALQINRDTIQYTVGRITSEVFCGAGIPEVVQKPSTRVSTEEPHRMLGSGHGKPEPDGAAQRIPM